MSSGKTKQPFSTISYNTKEFLTQYLDDLVKDCVIRFWVAIQHKGELLVDPITGKATREKDHWHVYIIPNKPIDWMEFSNNSCEVDPTHDKPLRCIKCRATNSEADWIWYETHEAIYILTHHYEDQKEFTYTFEDFITGEGMEDEWESRYFDAIHSGKVQNSVKVHRLINEGHTLQDLADIGYVNEHNASGLMAWDKLRKDKLETCLLEAQELLNAQSLENKKLKGMIEKIDEEKRRMLEIEYLNELKNDIAMGK